MKPSQSVENNPAGLLSQQIWCWGRDIHRPAGNWLLEIGFNRTQPPSEKKNCASVYTLSLSASKHIVIRGFGVLFSDDSIAPMKSWSK